MILFLSNGAGEDAIGARIAHHLQLLRPELELGAFPLVGAGLAYPFERYGVAPPTPSGGLSNESWRLLLHDLRSGLLGRIADQLMQLRRLRKRTRRLVAVGDVLTVLLAGLAGHRPITFVGTAKSSHHHAYSGLERWVLRRFTDQIFARDELTVRHLQDSGLAASWLGNAMMDGLEASGLSLGIHEGLAIFPGSREATYTELPRLLEVYSQLHSQRPTQAAVALADSIDLTRLAKACSEWRYTRQADSGLVGWLERPGCTPVALVRGALGDVLANSRVALGQAGTAHEQAAGLGIPVVSLHPPQKPLGWYRGRQKGLLGEALWVVSPAQAVPALLQLFEDDRERQRRGAVGRERLGPSGGASRIAEWLANAP